MAAPQGGAEAYVALGTVQGGIRELTAQSLESCFRVLQAELSVIAASEDALRRLVSELVNRAVTCAEASTSVAHLCGRFEAEKRFKTTLLSHCQQTFNTLCTSPWAPAACVGLGSFFGALHAENLIPNQIAQTCIICSLCGTGVERTHVPSSAAMTFACTLYISIEQGRGYTATFGSKKTHWLHKRFVDLRANADAPTRVRISHALSIGKAIESQGKPDAGSPLAPAAAVSPASRASGSFRHDPYAEVPLAEAAAAAAMSPTYHASPTGAATPAYPAWVQSLTPVVLQQQGGAPPPRRAQRAAPQPFNLPQLLQEAAIYKTQAAAEAAITHPPPGPPSPPSPPRHQSSPTEPQRPANRVAGGAPPGAKPLAAGAAAQKQQQGGAEPSPAAARWCDDDALPGDAADLSPPKKPATNIFDACATRREKRRLGNLIINKALQEGYNRSYGAARRKVARFCRMHGIGEADQSVLVEFLNDLFLAGKQYRGLCLKEFVDAPSRLLEEGLKKKARAPGGMRTKQRKRIFEDDEIESVMSFNTNCTDTWHEAISDDELEELAGWYEDTATLGTRRSSCRSLKLDPSSCRASSAASSCDHGDQEHLTTPPAAALDIDPTTPSGHNGSVCSRRSSRSIGSRTSRASRASSKAGLKYSQLPDDLT
eukprot:gene9002-13936_t